MGRRLAAAVHVQHPKTHGWLILQPGDEPDEDLAEVITNPDAWEDDDPADQEPDDEPQIDPGTQPAPAPEPESTPEAEPTPAPEQEPVKHTRTRAARKAADEQ
jgi:hypothetical protein